MPILLCSADPREIDVSQLKHPSLGLVYRPVGVGLVAASAGITRALQELRPRAVVLVGSCGVFPSQNIPLHTLVVGQHFFLLDEGLSQQSAELPQQIPQGVSVASRLAEDLFKHSGAKNKVRVGCTLGITTSDSRAHVLEASGCEVENLEGYSLAVACAQENIPFAALFVVSNRVGKEGRSAWQKHHAAGAHMCRRAIEQWLNQGNVSTIL